MNSELIVSDDEYLLLCAIADGADDPRRIAALLDADPSDVRQFLEEVGAVEDPAAQRLLRAALEHRQAKLPGAVRGIERSQERRPAWQALLSQFEEELRSLDAEVNSQLPRAIRSPRANNRREAFSSEKVLRSLAGIGIPVGDGLSILENVSRFLPSSKTRLAQLTTADIRRAVLSAIYDLDVPADRPVSVQEWGDRYARRYGNPDIRIRVVDHNQGERVLDYRFVEDEIIPTLVERILGVPLEVARQGGVGVKDVNLMSRAIVEHVQNLNLYHIHRKTLEALAFDLAVQPPHPWFVSSWKMSDTVRYDLDKAAAHRALLNRTLNSGKWEFFKHALAECVHHSCSALLGYYGGFLGASYLHPLYQLSTYLHLEDPDRRQQLNRFSRVSQLPGDLAGIGESPEALSQVLAKMRRMINSPPDHRLPELAVQAARLYEMVRGVITTRVEQVDEPLARLEAEDDSVDVGLGSVFWEVAKRIPECRPMKSLERGKGLFWVQCDFGPDGQPGRTRLLAAQLDSVDASLHKRVNQARAAIDKSSIEADAVVFLSAKERGSTVAAEASRGVSWPKKILVLNRSHVQGLYDAPDRAQALGHLLTTGQVSE